MFEALFVRSKESSVFFSLEIFLKIYIYIEREREHVSVCVCMCVCVCAVLLAIKR